MKINHNARSFAAMVLLLLSVAGCEAVGLPDLTKHDDVPSDIKEMPRLVTSPSEVDQAKWPRLGDVPAKPKNFSPKPVYDQAMDEMLYERGQGEQALKEAEATSPTPSFAIDMPDVPAGTVVTPTTTLAPPKFKFGKDK